MLSDDRGLRDKMIAELPRVRRFAFVLTGSHAEADDLLQATVERVLRKGAPDDADIAKWMFRVCRNIWIDGIRASQTDRAAVERGMSDAVTVVDGEAVAMGRVTLARVNAALMQLPESQRSALGLVAYAGCSYREAAEILGKPIGTIMSRISRARQALVDELGPDLEIGGTRIRQSIED